MCSPRIRGRPACPVGPARRGPAARKSHSHVCMRRRGGPAHFPPSPSPSHSLSPLSLSLRRSTSLFRLFFCKAWTSNRVRTTYIQRVANIQTPKSCYIWTSSYLPRTMSPQLKWLKRRYSRQTDRPAGIPSKYLAGKSMRASRPSVRPTRLTNTQGMILRTRVWCTVEF